MKNIYNNVFHLNKLPGYKRSTPLLLSSLLGDRTGRIYTVCCNTYALSFIFARMFNDDLSPCRTASVLASCMILARSSRRSFYESRNPFNNMDPLSRTDVIQSESFVNLLKEQRNYVMQILDELVVALTTGMLRFKLTFSHIDSDRLHWNSNSSTYYVCCTEQNSNSVSFSQSQCCRLRNILLTRFSS